MQSWSGKKAKPKDAEKPTKPRNEEAGSDSDDDKARTAKAAKEDAETDSDDDKAAGTNAAKGEPEDSDEEPRKAKVDKGQEDRSQDRRDRSHSQYKK